MTYSSGKVWRVLGSTAQGGSTASGLLSSAKWEDGVKIPLAVIAGSADFLSFYFLQGQELEESAQMPKPGTITRKQSRCLQVTYLIADTCSAFIDRYFLLTTAEKLIKPLPSAEFWLLLIIDVLVYQLFATTNESFETAEGIAQMNGEEKPFYENCLSYIGGEKARNIISGVGSFEHTVVADILPLVLLALKLASYATLNDKTTAALLGTAGVICIILATLIGIQTFFYEGKYTRENLAESVNEEDTLCKDITLPNCCVDTLIFATKWITGPVHGISVALPYLFALEPLSLEVAGLATAAAFFVATTVFNKTEGQASIEKYEGLRAEKEKPPETRRLYVHNNLYTQPTEDGQSLLASDQLETITIN